MENHLLDRVLTLEKIVAENHSVLQSAVSRIGERATVIEDVIGIAQGRPLGGGDMEMVVGAQLIDTQGPRLDRIENTLAELAGTITNLVRFLSTPNKFELASAGPDPATQGLPSPAPRRGHGRPSGSKTKTAKPSSSRRKA